MVKRYLIGTVTTDHEKTYFNNSFAYAADFEDVKIEPGTYNIYAYADDLKEVNGRTVLGWRNYIGYKGTVLRGNVGNKPGDFTECHVMIYDFQLAKHFLNGKEWDTDFVHYFYTLDEAFELILSDSEYDGQRRFHLTVALREGIIPKEI